MLAALSLAPMTAARDEAWLRGARWARVLLAPYVAIEPIHKLITAQHPGTSVLGIIIITALSLAIMPVLGIAKHRLGARLNSGATAGEGTQNLLCAYLAAPSWPAWPQTPGSAGGGWTPSSDSPSPRSRSGRALSPGEAKTAADSPRIAKSTSRGPERPSPSPGQHPRRQP